MEVPSFSRPFERVALSASEQAPTQNTLFTVLDTPIQDVFHKVIFHLDSSEARSCGLTCKAFQAACQHHRSMCVRKICAAEQEDGLISDFGLLPKKPLQSSREVSVYFVGGCRGIPSLFDLWHEANTVA